MSAPALAAHTPGPWIVDDRHVHCTGGHLTYPRGVEPETDVIVAVDTDSHARGLLNETDKCNLRLIASAPDLLAALERLANAVTAHRQAITIRALDELCDAEDNARDQIAKAKGQP